jgi:hypothetical protein
MSKFVIVRSSNAGCFFGELTKYDKTASVVTLKDARRLWYWDGAASLSDMAANGVAKPENCKFPPAVSEQSIHNVIEVLTPTEKAIASIQGVKPWTRH